MKKLGMTGAEAFWYVLGCISLGSAYLAKVPVKRAMADYGLVPHLTTAEAFWYYAGCVCFGASYFMKLPVAKAISELPEFTKARQDALDTAPRIGGLG